MKSKGKLANALFFLSLLCIFVICSVLVVSYQIGGYHQILENNETIQNQSLVVSYLRNQVRFHDGQDKIKVKNIDGVDVLALYQETTVTYLYAYDGSLKEFYTVDGYPLTLGNGESLFPLDEMNIKYHDDQLEIKTTHQQHQQTILISLQCEGGNNNA